MTNALDTERLKALEEIREAIVIGIGDILYLADARNEIKRFGDTIDQLSLSADKLDALITAERTQAEAGGVGVDETIIEKIKLAIFSYTPDNITAGQCQALLKAILDAVRTPFPQAEAQEDGVERVAWALKEALPGRFPLETAKVAAKAAIAAMSALTSSSQQPIHAGDE